MRRILAIGGGSFQMEAGPSPVDALILRTAGKPRPRVCFVGTPSGDLPEHIDKFYTAFPPTVCEPSHLAFFRKPGDRSIPLGELEQQLLQQDVVYVGGGNTKSALGVWREWGFDRMLTRAYESGILLCGMSAGAMCWFEAGITDSFWGAGYQPLACLGFVAGGCAVHYNADPQRRLRLHEALRVGAVPPTIAIDDCSAVLFVEGRPSRVYSWGGGKGACSVVAGAAGVTETLLESESLMFEA